MILEECELLTANFMNGPIYHFKKSSLIFLDEFPYYCRVRIPSTIIILNTHLFV